MKIATIALLTLLFAGCASKPLTSEETAIRLLRKSDAGKECNQVGKIHSPGLTTFTPEGHEDNLKRESFKLGGDTVTLDRVDSNNTHWGTVYKCNK